MKYTKENLIGIGIESNNRDESYIIIDKLASLGIDKNWIGNSSLCYYGLDRNGYSNCSSTMSDYNKIITFEEFIDLVSSKETPTASVIDNFEIY